jgi:molybdate transport system ATP-binding protein
MDGTLKLFIENTNPFEKPEIPFSWQINESENWLITSNGNETNLLIQWLTAKRFSNNGKVINHFSDVPEYGIDNLQKHLALADFQGDLTRHANFYYQQRYNATEINGIATARMILFNNENFDANHETQVLLRLFDAEKLLDKEIIKLSTGEYRKISIIKAIYKNPEILILVEPFAGLDKESRIILNDLLHHITQKNIIVILVSNSNEIPEFITHTLQFKDFVKIYAGEKEKFQFSSIISNGNNPEYYFYNPSNYTFDKAFELKNVYVCYDDRNILDKLNWEVKNNEKWALTGKNGAGKSMLLSLIFADNPQVYSNEIYLFDKRRGTGESIWEIKERIAYFSSELFLYADKSKTIREIAFAFLNANPYNRKTATIADENQFQFLMKYFEITQFENKQLYELPIWLQRLSFLIGIFIHSAPVVILDEPFQSFTQQLVEKAKKLIDITCKNRTLIFVSHRIEEFPESIQHTFLLKNGKGQII